MRKAIILIILLLLIIPYFNCTKKDTYNIAIIQHQHFQPYDQAHKGFLKGMEKYSRYLKYEIVEDYNADSRIDLLDKKIEEVSKREDIDIIFSIGTHTTQRMVKVMKKTPFVFTIVGDPEGAGIVKDWKTSGANYTGVETKNYYSKVVGLVKEFVPFKKLGMIYLEGSPSHEAGIKQLTAFSKEMGFEFYYTGFPLRKDGKPFPRDQVRENIRKSLDEICPKVDIFFVQTSNAFTNEFDLFQNAFIKYKVLSCGDAMNIKKGLALGISKDAKRFGMQCAQYAYKILRGTRPADLPMSVGVKLMIDVNLTAYRAATGGEPPLRLLTAADNLYD